MPILAVLACGTPSPSATEPSSARDAREVCEAVMRRTRECGDLYVPALLRMRARYDRPPGIAARYHAEGEDVLLPIAREEFRRDWSEAGIDAHCDDLDRRAPEECVLIVERERSCLPVASDCPQFVECNMALLERRWSAAPPPPTE